MSGQPVAIGPTTRPQCETCYHKSRGQCPECGGQLGHPALGLSPCPVCPHGTRIGIEPGIEPGIEFVVEPPMWPTWIAWPTGDSTGSVADASPPPPGPEESTPYIWPEWMPPC